MTNEKWAIIVHQLKDTYSILEEGKEDLDDRPGSREFVEFVGAGDLRMRIERLSYPPVTGKTARGGARIGAASHVAYTYSDTEMIDRLELYRWSDHDDDWIEIKAGLDAFIA